MPFITDTFLRRAERDDLDILMAWMEAPDFQHFLYGDPAHSRRQVREQIISMLGRPAGHTMPGGIYLLIDSKEHGPIGLLSLQKISWRNRSCIIDLYIGREEFRTGMVTAIAVYRTLEYCFDELNLHRVAAYIYDFNKTSWRIFELTGAKRELTLRQQVARDGELRDVYAYGLLRPEFEELRAKHGAQMEGVNLEAMMRALTESEAEPQA